MSILNNKKHEQEAHITFKLKRQDGFEVLFRVKRNTPLKKHLNAYCFRHFIMPKCVTFLFLGRLFQPEQTPNELEMKEGDVIDAYFHETEAHKNNFVEVITKEMAEDEEDEAFVLNMVMSVLWKVVSKVMAGNSSIIKEITKLINDEEKEAVFIKTGRIFHELIRGYGGQREEIKMELTRLSEELREDLKEVVISVLKEREEDDDYDDEEEEEEEDDEYFAETGRRVFELVEWAKKNHEFVRCIVVSKL
ncbi:hypothetical protein QVD17_14075 [Tagetes erecta]|uniref:Rad60/SUMO-like domain-containing protein n=1 Tax=Tagetes erecta TaxID=13708 RepID=A0AAD8KWM7_TARER|nr:hypothetical protein QVD17_14075 [Tagetes erecta]